MIPTPATLTNVVVESSPLRYLVNYGKSGGLGNFISQTLPLLRRGDRVIIDSPRGREVGTVLCPTSPRQSQILGSPSSSGTITRTITAADEAILKQARLTEHLLFEAARQLAMSQALPLEILDVEMLLEGCALLQFVAEREIAPLDGFVEALNQMFQLDIRLENLAPAPTVEEPQSCGKPDCGKTEGGGGCSTCSTGGGCTSCGSAKTDLRPYFAHLRTQMEGTERTSLV